MNSKKPLIIFNRDKENDISKLEIQDLKTFCNILSSEVVTHFCRCFVHVDRLTSLKNFENQSREYNGESSIVYARDLQTIFWFAVGTLRELALSIKDLHNALSKEKILDINSNPWKYLSDLEKRWNNDPFLRDKRNKVSFHIDSNVIKVGLKLMESYKKVILFEGQGENTGQMSLCLGINALQEYYHQDFESFVKIFLKDQSSVSTNLQEALIMVLRTKGIDFGEAKAMRVNPLD